RDRRVAHAPVPELGEQPLGDLVGALVGAHLLAQEEHALVARHLLAHRLVERLAHREDGHYFVSVVAGAGVGRVMGGRGGGTWSSRTAAFQAGSRSAAFMLM